MMPLSFIKPNKQTDKQNRWMGGGKQHNPKALCDSKVYAYSAIKQDSIIYLERNFHLHIRLL